MTTLQGGSLTTAFGQHAPSSEHEPPTVVAHPDAVADVAAPIGALQLSRSQILDATAVCLRESGYDGTTIRRIAGQLGCAVGSIYRYFRDKRDLLDAVAQRRLEAVAKLVDGGCPFEQTAALYLQRAAEDAEQYRLMFWLACVGREADAAARPMALMPAVVQRIVEGWSKQLGGSRAAHAAWSLLHGAAMLGRDKAAALQDALRCANAVGGVAPAEPVAPAAAPAPSPARAPEPTPAPVPTPSSRHSDDLCLL